MKRLLTAMLLVLLSGSYAATYLSEDFESTAIHGVPDSWSAVENNGSGTSNSFWAVTNLDAHESELAIHVANYTSDTNGDYLITPAINFGTEDVAKTLKFWAKSYDADHLNSITIRISTTDQEIESFATIIGVEEELSTDWVQYSYTLPQSTGTVYLAFENTHAWGAYLLLDDVTVTSVSTTPVFTITPESQEFQLTTVGESSQGSFTIKNDGIGTLTIADGNISLIGVNANQFSLGDITYPIELEFEEEYTFMTSFNPVDGGEKVAQIQIIDDIAKLTHTVDLMGTGFKGLAEGFEGETFPPEGWASYKLGASTVTEGWVQNGLTDYGSNCAFHNDDREACEDWLVLPKLNISADAVISFFQKTQYGIAEHGLYISTGSANPADGDFVELHNFDQGNTTWTEKTFNLVDYAGTNDCYLAFKYVGTYESRWRMDDLKISNVSLSGAPAIPEFAIVPENHIFESTTTGTVSEAVDFVISNSGDGALEIVEGAITLIGDNADQFALNLDGLTFPISLEGDETVTVPATFTPEAVGEKVAQIQIIDNITKATNLIDLSGEGIEAIPGFAIDKEAYAFTRTFVNEASETVNFVITNSGDGLLAIAADGITLVGDNADQFTLDLTESALPANLAAGETTTIKATFNPTLLGENSAQIKIVDNIAKAEHLVDLSATCFEGYEEDFEGDTFPEGWSVKTNTLIDGGLNGVNLVDPATTDYSTWFDFAKADLGGAGAIYVHTGDKAIGVFGGDFAVNLQWLLSKEYTLGSDPELAFWMYFLRNDMTMFGSPNKLYVQIKEAGSKEGWETILSYNTGTITNAYYNEQSAELTDYANKTVQLAFVLDCTEYHTSSKAIIDDFSISTKDESAIEENMVETTILHQNYPNPFNPNTTIKFFNKNAGSVKLSVFNMKGELVQNLVNRNMQAGNHNINFNASNLNSGVYYYTLQTAEKSITKKMIMVK